MKKIKRLFIFFVLVFLFLVIGNKSDAASENLELNNLNFDAEIQENGDMKVTETWDIDIEDTNTLYKTFKTDINKYLNIKDVTVKEITDGENKDFTETSRISYHVNKDYYYGLLNNDGDFEIAWGVGLDDDEDTRIYEISYTVEGAVGKYTDYFELYWQFVGEDFEVDAKKIAGTITLPNSVENKDEIRVWGHTAGLNGEIYVTDNNKIEFTINDFKAGTYVEVRTLFPVYTLNGEIQRTYDHPILDDVLEEEKVWAEEANRLRNQRMMYVAIFYIAITVISVFIIVNIIRKIKVIKTRKERKPSEEIIYFREIPREDASPAEAVFLEGETKTDLQPNDTGKIFSATLLNFSLKKLIEIESTKDEKGKDEISIKLLNKDKILELENKDEKAIGKFLISAFSGKEDGILTVKELEKFIKKSSQTEILNLQEDIRQGTRIKLLDKKLIDKEGQEKYAKESGMQALYIALFVICTCIAFALVESLGTLVLAGCIAFGIIMFLNIVATGIAISKINVFTQEGIDEIAKWKGLKKYMEEFSLLDKREVPEIAIWEHFLVFATAFGIADKVLDQLKIVYPDIENTINVNTYPYMYLMIHTDFSRSFSNAISTSMSYAYTSASGGGGGFSGGGRWWPVAGGGGGGR